MRFLEMRILNMQISPLQTWKKHNWGMLPMYKEPKFTELLV